MTAWDEHVADYLRLRRQLGFSLAWDEHLLGQLTAHLAAAGAKRLTIEAAIAWAGLLPAGVTKLPATRASTRMTAVRGFAAYLHQIDPAHEVPPRGVFATHVRRARPYIYTPSQIAALLEAAGQLRRFDRDHIYPALFGLLAATGLRVGEALALNIDEADLDAGVLTISRGKSRDPRLVPLHLSTTQALTCYASWRDAQALCDNVEAADIAALFTERDSVIDATGEVTTTRSLTADEYEAWVDWINPVTGESMGIPRKPGAVRKGSPLFAEMTINAPKSLSVAVALHPEVSEALDAAQRDAARELQRFLGQHSVTLAGPRGAQEVLPVEHMQTVAITHKTSRGGDPHRHIHFQIGTRGGRAGSGGH